MVNSVVESTQLIRQAELFCQEMLPEVSRTFALSIRFLPGNLGRSVLCAYLLCRIADTIEDDAQAPPANKIVLLDRLMDSFENPTQATHSISSNGKRRGRSRPAGAQYRPRVYDVSDATRSFSSNSTPMGRGNGARDEGIYWFIPPRHPHQNDRRIQKILLLRGGNRRPFIDRPMVRVFRRDRSGWLSCALKALRSLRSGAPKLSISSRISLGMPSTKIPSMFPHRISTPKAAAINCYSLPSGSPRT